MTREWDEGKSKHHLCSAFFTLDWNLIGMILILVLIVSAALPSRTGSVYDTRA